MMAQVLVRCAIAVCFDRANADGLDVDINKLYRLKRIIAAVRQYYGLHPNYSKDTYGTMENYLRQHISEHDWALLAQVHFVGSTPEGSRLPKAVLDIA